MKYLINLCFIFAVSCGETEAMTREVSVSHWMGLSEFAIKSEICRNDLFMELNSAMHSYNNSLVRFLEKEACKKRFRGWSEEQKAALLFYAVENGLEEVVEDCADSRFNLDVRGYYGETPLLLAVERGYDTTAEYLLTSGADPNVADIRTGFSALMFASLNGNENLVRALIRSKANVNALSYLGCSPLSLAVGSDHQTIVRMLKDAGADVYLENQNGDTPISIALYYEQKLIENDMERAKWNAMVRILKKCGKPQEETVSAKRSIRSSVWSFLRSFFRRKS